MSPRYSGYIPNASLSPNVLQQSGYSSLDFTNSAGGSDYGQSSEKRYSPVGFQSKYNQYGYVGYQQQNYSQKSPYSLQTPDTSPTQSPEPKGDPKSPQDIKDNSQDDSSSALPTPELSPLEHQENAQYVEENKRVSNIQHTSNSTNPNSPTQNYTTRVQNFRPPNTVTYTNTQPITSVPMGNGMYVMCANKSSVEQGHVVTGTFYPPVATSQDQQMLGPAQNTMSNTGNATSSNIQYYNTHIQQFYAAKEYQTYEQHGDADAMGYSNALKGDVMLEKNEYDLSYKTAMNETYGYSNNPSAGVQMVQTYMPEERSDVDSDVDAREFDKYLKYTNSDPNVIDSNHNYHRGGGGAGDVSVNSNLTYNFQAQHTSVILPNTNVKSEPLLGPYPDVYGELAQNGVQKSDDDFSEILADVRKTCYSNWNVQ